LTLSIAGAGAVRRRRDGWRSCAARLAEDPIGRSRPRASAGALRVEAAFADAVALFVPRKRRLTIRERRPCAQRC